MGNEQATRKASTTTSGGRAKPEAVAQVFGTYGVAQQQTGTNALKFMPPTGEDIMQIKGTPQKVSTKQMCITNMKQYDNKSLEELRLEDYETGLFGQQNKSSAFGQVSRPIFLVQIRSGLSLLNPQVDFSTLHSARFRNPAFLVDNNKLQEFWSPGLLLRYSIYIFRLFLLSCVLKFFQDVIIPESDNEEADNKDKRKAKKSRKREVVPDSDEEAERQMLLKFKEKRSRRPPDYYRPPSPTPKKRQGRAAPTISPRRQPQRKAKEAKYEVEYIWGKRLDQNGQTEYRVLWKHYPVKESTWELETNLSGAKDTIAKYEQRALYYDHLGQQALIEGPSLQNELEADHQQQQQQNLDHPVLPDDDPHLQPPLNVEPLLDDGIIQFLQQIIAANAAAAPPMAPDLPLPGPPPDVHLAPAVPALPGPLHPEVPMQALPGPPAAALPPSPAAPVQRKSKLNKRQRKRVKEQKVQFNEQQQEQ